MDASRIRVSKIRVAVRKCAGVNPKEQMCGYKMRSARIEKTAKSIVVTATPDKTNKIDRNSIAGVSVCGERHETELREAEQHGTEPHGTEQNGADRHDPVNHPSHYTQGGIECIDAIQSAVSGLSGVEAWLTGSIIKYVWRQRYKNGIEDLRKAKFYIDRLIRYYEGGDSSQTDRRGHRTGDAIQTGCSGNRTDNISQDKGDAGTKLPPLFGKPVIIRRVRHKTNKTNKTNKTDKG